MNFRIAFRYGAGMFGVVMLPSLALLGQTRPNVTAAGRPSGVARPAQSAQIVKYEMTSDGVLRISYGDGTAVEIQKERGRYDVPQEAFSQIHIAGDRRHIGWRAEYSVCAQSYPCSPEIIVYRAG